MQSKWFHNWEENVPETQVSRALVLRNMKRISEDEELLSNSATDLRVSWARQLSAFGVLNRSQIAVVTGLTRQRVAEFLEGYEPKHTVRGQLDTWSISPMLEIVTRLQGQDSIPLHLLLTAQTRTDKSLVQHLTGIPIHTLRRVRKNIEAQSGIRLPDNRSIH